MLESTADLLSLSLGVLFHPIETFDNIKKNRRFFSYIPVLVLLFAIFAARVATIFLIHFPLARGMTPETANFVTELVKFVVPVVGWAISCYIVTSIMGGECHFKEMLTASCYAMMPYILFSVPLALFSKVLSGSDRDVYGFLEFAMWAWVGLLFFLSVKTLNNYTFVKTVWICVTGIIAMAIIIAVLVLVYAMINQLIQLIMNLLNEIRMLNW